MRPRVSIAHFLAIIAFCGVAFAALRSATDWWASGIFTATLIGLALAAAFAAQRRGPRRAFWTAFVAFGAGYMVLAFGPWCETSIRPRLLTTKLLDALYARVTAGTAGPVCMANFSPDGRILPIGQSGGTVRMLWGPDATRQDRFQSIGHALAALLLAGIGGTASRYFYAYRDERHREAAEKAAGVLLKVLEAGM